jgi:hypothetical protein
VGYIKVVAVQAEGYAPALENGDVATNDTLKLAMPEGYTFVTRTLVTEKNEPLKMTLKPGGTIRARVVDGRGNPVANMMVDPFYWRETQVLRAKGGRNVMARTDADGMLEWRDAPAEAITFDPVTNTYLRKNFQLKAGPDVQTVVLEDVIPVTMAVTDAETKAAVEKFSVTYGRGSEARDADHWGTDGPGQGVPTEGAGGKYETVIRASANYHFFRIEAPGYGAVVTKFKEGERPVMLKVEMPKETALALEVRKPDGTAAAGTAAYVVTKEMQWFNLVEYTEALANPERGWRGKGREVRTDGAGKLRLADPRDSEARLVVADKAGYAEMRLADAVKAGKVVMQGWARLEGVAMAGRKPWALKEVGAQYEAPAEGGPARITASFEAKTDEAGRFEFDRLPPGGRIIVGRKVVVNEGTMG